MAKAKYGWQHQKERARWRRLVDAGGIECCFCGSGIEPRAPFDLDHVPGTDTAYRGAAHTYCNRADGGRLRHTPPRRLSL